jgi:hypothetical protein
VYIRSTPSFQARPKSIRIQQSPAKPEQNQSKEKAWIPLDFLVRIERFQWVAPTPQAKKFSHRSFPADGRRTKVRFG